VIDDFRVDEGDKLDLRDYWEIRGLEDIDMTQGSIVIHLGNNQTIHIMNMNLGEMKYLVA
jgi:hypothetical protein